VTFFEDMLTDPRCPLSGQDFSTNRTYGFFFGIFDRLNQIENIADNTDQLAELRLSVAIECLRRLSGETPARRGSCVAGNRIEIGLAARLSLKESVPNILADSHQAPRVVRSCGISSILGSLIRYTRYRRRSRVEIRLALTSVLQSPRHT
jgi:hypothetical protein